MKDCLALPGGGHLAYEVRGTGTPLLLVAGLGGLGSFWDLGGFAHRCVRAGRSVILYDHRGTGGSSRCDRPYTIGTMAEDAIVLMDHLGVRTADLVGHSTGGAIGQVLALGEGKRIGRLVLSATWARACPYMRRLFEARLEILAGLGLQAYRRHAAIVLNAPYWISRNDSVLTEELSHTSEHPLDAELTMRRIRAILAHDVLERLGTIRCPTLVVSAADDAVIPAYHGDALASAIPGARQAPLPRGGHFLPRAEPEAYANAVLPFLTAGGGPS